MKSVLEFFLLKCMFRCGVLEVLHPNLYLPCRQMCLRLLPICMLLRGDGAIYRSFQNGLKVMFGCELLKSLRFIGCLTGDLPFIALGE